MKPRDLLVCLVVISGIGIIVGIVFIHSKKDKYTSGSPDELYGCCSYNKTNPNSLCGHAYADKVCTNNSELAGWTGCQTSTGDKLPVCFAKGTGCICNGFTCTGGGEGCDCGDTNLDSGSGCKKCRDGYEFNKLPDGTIDWEGQPCVPKPPQPQPTTSKCDFLTGHASVGKCQSSSRAMCLDGLTADQAEDMCKVGTGCPSGTGTPSDLPYCYHEGKDNTNECCARAIGLSDCCQNAAPAEGSYWTGQWTGYWPINKVCAFSPYKEQRQKLYKCTPSKGDPSIPAPPCTCLPSS